MRVLDLDPFATFLPLTISQVDTDMRWRLHARAENILPINKEMMTLDMRTVTILKTNVDTKKTLHDVEITLAIGFGIGWAVQMIAPSTPLNLREFCPILIDIALNFSISLVDLLIFLKKVI